MRLHLAPPCPSDQAERRTPGPPALASGARPANFHGMKPPAILALGLLTARISLAQEAASDPNQWLEDVSGERALSWVRDQDAVTQRELEASPDFKVINARLLAIYDSNERIPYVAKHGDYYYNFWQDAQHVRGIWRRTSPAEYRKKDTAWETVLDLDALSAEEKETWVWKGAAVRYPDYTRGLVRLSRGGGDAVVVREFDLAAKAFVKDGFALPEAKSTMAWRDTDSVYVGTNFGAGSMTDSGYPRIVKLWRRGTPIADARTVFEGQQTDVSSAAIVSPRIRLSANATSSGKFLSKW